MNTIKRVPLQLKCNELVAREISEEILNRANPHFSPLIEEKLRIAEIDIETMTKYIMQMICAVGEFWNEVHDVRYKATLRPHELRGMYCPLILAVILASVGNFDFGNYSYVLMANQEGIVDKEFLFQFSAKLESLRHIIKGDVGQVGNRNAKPMVSTMLSIMSTLSADNRQAEINIRDGVSYDPALSGLAALVGLSLVQEAYSILYTGVEAVNFRQLLGTIKQSED